MGKRNAAGSVMLKSADPTEPPEINLRYFTNGGEQDLQAMLEAVNFVETVKGELPASTEMNPFTEVHPCPGTSPSNCTDAEKIETLKLQAYSHHASGTCAMGKVVDSDFKVKGVNNLRVVDASVWPIPPGAFPVLPTFLLSRKAVETILGDA
jgi:choline dehydrogenase